MLNLLIGYSLAIASTLTVIAIPIKLFVSKNRSGVSYFTSTLAFYSMVCWAGYTMDLGDIPAYFSSLGPLVCWALSLVAMAFTYETRKVYWLILSLLIITSSLVVVRLNPSLLGVLAVSGSLCWSLPQLRKAFKARDLSGVSSTGYALIFLENLGWVVYALLTKHYAYALAPLVQGPSALYIAFKARKQLRTNS